MVAVVVVISLIVVLKVFFRSFFFSLKSVRSISPAPPMRFRRPSPLQ